MFKAYYEKLLVQLAVDFNSTPQELKAKETIITTPELNDGRRSYCPGKPFLQMATLGASTVIMADVCLHKFLQGMIKDVEGHHLFEFENLMKLIGVRINDYVDFVSSGTETFESEQRRFIIDHGLDEKYVNSNAYLAARCHVISYGYKI